MTKETKETSATKSERESMNRNPGANLSKSKFPKVGKLTKFTQPINQERKEHEKHTADFRKRPRSVKNQVMDAPPPQLLKWPLNLRSTTNLVEMEWK